VSGMRGDRFDVAVVGASLAGCAAATLFARRGLTVVLIERRSDLQAYKRTCTHFIQPCGTRTLERLGLTGPIEAAGGVRNSLHVWSPSGWVVGRHHDADGRRAYGYTIRREKLDPMIRELAATTPGVDLRCGLTATSLLRGARRFDGVVARDRDGREQRVLAQLVVGADGRDSRIAELARLRPRALANDRFMYFAYFRDLPLSSGPAGQMWFVEPDVAYAYPCDGDLTLLACFLTKDQLRAFKTAPEAQFARRFASLCNAPRLDGAERVSPLIGKLEMPNIRRPASVSGLALVGDAALAADPMWGVGCGWALQSAEWLADDTSPALAGREPLDRALRRYRRQHRRRLLAHHLVSASFSTRRRLAPHERLFLRAGARDRVTANRVAGFGERMIGVHEMFSPRSLARALWAASATRACVTRSPAEPTCSSGSRSPLSRPAL
jgi:2-polyprenyl-6-methoxyphenol hydroxylase-like FAD-dependent oxidoreductase